MKLRVITTSPSNEPTDQTIEISSRTVEIVVTMNIWNDGHATNVRLNIDQVVQDTTKPE